MIKNSLEVATMRIITHTNTNEFKGVYVNDFDDNYHRMSNEPSSELERSARRIRRRYKNIMQYLEAVDIYNEYMEYMYLKHGGKDLFKIKLQGEAIDDFVPSKPRMKNNAKNRRLLKDKIVISQVNLKSVTREKIQNFVEEMEDTLPEDNNLVIDTSKPLNKVEKKTLKNINLNSLKSKQIKGHTSSLEFLEEYFQNETARKKTQEEEALNAISVTDILSGKVDHLLYADEEDDNDVIYYQGNYMKRSAVNEIKIYEKLGEFGWDSVKLMKRGGVASKFTKHIERRNKRLKKKDKKGKKKKRDNDDFILHTVMGTDHDSFEDFEKEMMQFTADNIFK